VIALGLSEREYGNRDSNGNINYNGYNSNNASGKYVDVEDFIKESYKDAVQERDSSIFTKIKNKIVRLLRL
jgi:hypothetical protein